MGLSILALADRAELVPNLARWHRDEWGGGGDPEGSLAAWTEGLRRRSAFSRRRGWELVAREPYDREEVAFMAKDVGASRRPSE